VLDEFVLSSGAKLRFDTLATYLKHPAHVAIGNFMRPLRESRAAVDFYL
jgi:hypothetical protein